MVQDVLSGYHLTQPILKIEPITNGLINQTWLIKTVDEDFILQKVNHHIFKNPSAISENIRLIAEYLSNENPGYLFIAPVRTKDGKEMNFIEGKGYYRLLPFVKESHTINTIQKPEQAYEAAKEFGKFTKLLSEFPVKKLQITLPDFHNLTLRYQQFTTALENGNKERILHAQELIEFIKANKNIVDTYENILQDPAFKIRVTHHDTKISNVLFNPENKGLCVIDLDTVMPGYFISDVGDMIRTYLSPVSEEEKDFSKIEIRDDYFKAIAEGYLSEMNEELSPSEKNHFVYAGKFMIYMQAIRFLADYFNNDIYYNAKYDGHNLIRAKNQILLLEKLMKREEDLTKLIKN